MRRTSIAVLTPAADRSLCQLSAVKLALIIPPEDTSQDAALQDRIAAASGLIQRYCGRVLVAETVRETFRQDGGGRRLVLARPPVASIISLTIDEDVLDPADWELSAEAGVLYSDGLACAGKAVIVYEGGYSLEDMPPEISSACVDRVVRGWAGKDRDPNIRSESTDGVDSTSYFDPDKLSAEEKGLLGSYRTISL